MQPFEEVTVSTTFLVVPIIEIGQLTVTLEAVLLAGVPPSKVQLYVAPATGGLTWKKAPSVAQTEPGADIPLTGNGLTVTIT